MALAIRPWRPRPGSSMPCDFRCVFRSSAPRLAPTWVLRVECDEDNKIVSSVAGPQLSDNHNTRPRQRGPERSTSHAVLAPLSRAAPRLIIARARMRPSCACDGRRRCAPRAFRRHRAAPSVCASRRLESAFRPRSALKHELSEFNQVSSSGIDISQRLVCCEISPACATNRWSSAMNYGHC